MKIVAINGSHRGVTGYTHYLLGLIEKGAKTGNAEFETIILTNKKINICKGCRVCHTEKHYLECIYNDTDDVKEIFNTMKSADIIIYATPIYIFSMSAMLKIFLERITSTADSSIKTISNKGLFFHHITKEIASKPFLVITTQDNIEDETNINVVRYFETFSKFMDAPLLGVINRKLGGLIKHGKDPDAETKYPITLTVNNAFINCGNQLATKGLVDKKTLKQANLPLIKMPAIVEFLLKLNFIRNNKRIMAKVFDEAKKEMP
ncbi:MAG TPA: flavodoxin family protein [Melioribacteraceae bacterium]|nr:flavodoxin family protein [Melioribacteraceae bacterium]